MIVHEKFDVTMVANYLKNNTRKLILADATGLLVTHPCKFPSNTHVFLYTQTLSLFLACSLFGIPFLTHTQTLPTLDMTYTLQSHHKSIPKQMQVGMHECLFANGYCFPTPTQPEAGRELAYTLPFI